MSHINSTSTTMNKNGFVRSTGGAGPGRLQSAREELVSKRYQLLEPQGVYRLDNGTLPHTIPKFPDFLPWKHTTKEDDIALNHLQKGYFEPPHVSNELLSARNIVYQLLRCENSLDELSTNMKKSIDIRVTNSRITQGSFKPPPRVTLTDQKREAWLKDLANSNVPLKKLSRTIPHGVRNKVLVEHCINKDIPMNRAIWLVRCVGINELRGLKRKGNSSIESTWVQEWTTQVVEFVERLSADYLKFETFQQATESWKVKIGYLLRFLSNLFLENLIDRELFINWINKFFKSCKAFEIPLALTIIKIFWNEIIKGDHLIKELTESLILKYQKINTTKNMLDSKDISITDFKLNDKIKSRIIQEISSIIVNSFNQSIDNFILPNSWSQIRPTLRSILELNSEENIKKFELISYRNESLMINSSTSNPIIVNDLVSSLDCCKENVDLTKILDLIVTDDWRQNLETALSWCLTKYRSEQYRVLLVLKIVLKMRQYQVGQISITGKDIGQTLLDFIFELHNMIDVIELDNLFVLLNHMIDLNIFKTPIYIRRLISSGLVYLKDNQSEKLLHASILKNLKPHKSNQTTMILKNLEPNFQETISVDEKLKFGMDSLEKSAANELKSFSFIENMDTGIKMKLSDMLIQSILSRSNFFPLMTYSELKDNLSIFLHLGDMKNLVTFVLRALKSGELDGEQLELVTLFIISSHIVFEITGDFESTVELIIAQFRLIMSGVNAEYPDLRGFWTFALAKVDQESIKDEVRVIMSGDKSNVNTVTLLEKLNISGLNISLEQFLDFHNFHGNFQQLIRSLFNNSLDLNKRKCLVDLLSVLRRLNISEFNKTLFVFIKKTYTNTNELFKYEPLYDLVVSELITINTMIETFKSFDSSAYCNFVMDLLFKELSQPEVYDYFRLKLLREQFKKKNPDVMLDLLKKSLIDKELKIDSIQSESTELITSLLTETSLYKTEFLSIFLENIIHNRDLVIKVFLNDPSLSDKVASLLNETLLSTEDGAEVDESSRPSLNTLLKNLKKLNKFNLPIFQLLFKLSLHSEVSQEEISQIFRSCFHGDTIGGSENLSPSLFELLEAKSKIRLIHYLEYLFLNSKSFPSVMINDEKIDLKITSDILTSLSRTVPNLGLTDELVFSLDVCLESLLKIVSQSQEMTDFLHAAISLFLKIIIIHKSFIVGIIIERNSIKESFLNNIVNLLNTKIVSANLQLKNLLYDLIISIKSSVNDVNQNQPNAKIKLPISMLDLPAVSSQRSTLSHCSVNSQNLHDFNVVNNFVLYQKSSSTYCDFTIKPFDMLEDSNPMENINDTAISLQLFDASLERKNPGVVSENT